MTRRNWWIVMLSGLVCHSLPLPVSPAAPPSLTPLPAPWRHFSRARAGHRSYPPPAPWPSRLLRAIGGAVRDGGSWEDEEEEVEVPPPPSAPPRVGSYPRSTMARAKGEGGDDDGFTVAAGLAAIGAAGEEERQGEEEVDDEDAGMGGEQQGIEGRADGKSKLGRKQALDPHAALQYRVVAIMGCQSSGKSTLLNRIFGTDFPVLDAAVTGIQRTTRGIWADVYRGRSANAPSTVILDMEGLESGARGEQSPIFDRSIACMAASVADIIVVNVWYKDMMRGRAAGPEHVFQQLAGLKEARPRMVVVVVRDAENVKELALRPLKAKLVQTMRDAYQDVGKGPAAARDMIDLQLVAMPHPRYEAERFEAGVVGLRKLLVDDDNNNGTGKPAKTRRKKWDGRLHPVPLSGFAVFARGLWESLRVGEGQQQDVDEHERRPMEEEIRAYMRTKVVEGCCHDAEKAIRRLQHKVDNAVDMPILEFGADAEAIFSTAQASVRARLQGSGGRVAVSNEDKEALEQEVLAELSRCLEPVYKQHLEALGYYFTGKFQDRFAGLFCPVEEFNRESSALLADVCGTFDRAARAARPKAVSSVWNYEPSMARLKEDLEVDIVDRRIEVEVAFPREATGRKLWKPSWWKKVLLKAVVVYANYLQTKHAVQAVSRAAKKRQQKFPPFPLF